MSRIQLNRHYIGLLDLPDGKVDVTDPCYDNDVWCRLNDIEVLPGTYDCYAYMGVDKTFGNRCWIARIAIADEPYAKTAENKIFAGGEWEAIGEIGVDAGMAGFFHHKPDFNDEEWRDVCNAEYKGNAKAYLESFTRDGESRQGFWTDSGVGDGGYPVYAIREEGKIIALEIRFF